jgi:hypothetical protein
MESATITSNGKRANRAWHHTWILTLTLLMAQASLMYTCYEAGRIEGTRASGGFLTEFPYTLNGFHGLITLCLVLCAIGLWLRKPTGFFISSTALVVVILIYGYWHGQTVKYLSEFQTEDQNYSRLQAEVGFFHGATKWDLVVLALVAILLLWQVVTLIKMILERRKTSAGP